MHTFLASLPHRHLKKTGVLSRYNHSPDIYRGHRETIIFHEINRVSGAFPLCPQIYYSRLYQLLLKNNKTTNSAKQLQISNSGTQDGTFFICQH